MRNRHIVIFGNYGSVNWGDECILAGLLSQLPSELPVTVVSSNPGRTVELHNTTKNNTPSSSPSKEERIFAVVPPPFGLRSLLRPWWRTLGVLRSVRYVIFGGGGLLQDREPRAIRLWSWYARVVRWCGAKTLWVANGIGPLSSASSQRLARAALADAKYISLRDRASAQFCSEHQPVQTTDAALLFPKAKKATRRRGSLVCLRGDGSLSPTKARQIITALPKPVTAVAMDAIDQEFAQKLGCDVIQPESIAQLQSCFAAARIVLGSRLHAGILALKHQTPFVLLGAAPKLKNFFKDRDLGAQVIAESASTQKIVKHCQQTLKQSKTFQKKLQQIYLSERKKAKMLLPPFLQKS